MKNKTKPLSLKDWKKVYFPTKPTSKMTTLEATKHCLQKWKGLLPNVLKKYNLKLYSYILCDEDSQSVYDITMNLKEEFPIDQTTCALCKCSRFFSRNCKGCPVATFDEPCGNCVTPFTHFIDTGNPKRMIKLLEKIVAELEKKQ